MSGQTTLIPLDDVFRRELDELGVEWQPSDVPAPELIMLNDELATELGLDPEALRSPDGVAILAGNAVPDDAHPIAMAYAGHQFGNYSPRLGDGRALLLGEIVDAKGRRWDLHLKGSGRTPFARGGDGKAALAPMLREYVIAEAMFALGVPTTRSLAVAATGQDVHRSGPVPGGVLARIASSHIRVGTFEYAARLSPDLVRRLADHAIDRHHSAVVGEAADGDRYLGFLDAVITTQAALVGKWMEIGFIHGVMNTDNMTISGETIDYGPCAFLDVYDPRAVFSSIDHGGRYAFGNQPAIAQWNLSRLAETLLPLLDERTEAAVEKATAALDRFPAQIRAAWHGGMAAKLGLADANSDRSRPTDQAPDRETVALINEYLQLLNTNGLDYTTSFRSLAGVLRGAEVAGQLHPAEDLADWAGRWQTAVDARAAATGVDRAQVAAAMDRINPIYIPRNQLVEQALEASTGGDHQPLRELVERVTHPFDAAEGAERYGEPASPEFTASYQTFCGT